MIENIVYYLIDYKVVYLYRTFSLPVHLCVISSNPFNIYGKERSFCLHYVNRTLA